MAEPQDVKKGFDWKFTFGLVLLLFGYAVINFLIYFLIFGLPFYLIGAILIGFSRASTKAKLIIILFTLIVNFYTYSMIGLLFFTN